MYSSAWRHVIAMELVISTLAEKLSTVFKDTDALKLQCKNIVLDIQSGKFRINTLIDELETFLINKDVEQRKQGIHILSLVLSMLPKDILNATELNFFLEFYAERLKDDYKTLPGTLQGILSIFQMANVPSDILPKLFSNMFQNVHCQSLQRIDRRTVYLLFRTVLYNHLDKLKEICYDFVYGVISSIDGERDPRNLLIIFRMLPYFMKELPLAHMTEDMFEIIACYFPVDYTPTGTDDDDVTREDLAETLAPCLYAVPEFAQFCLPLIIEKLQSALKVAKLDSLKVLSASVVIFGVNGLKPYITEIWSCLKDEAMSNDREVKAVALQTLTNVVYVLSTSETVRQSFIEQIFSETKWTLCDIQLNSFWSTEQILEAVANANIEACKQVLRTVIPLCLGQHSSKSSVGEKVIVLQTLRNFLNISSNFDFSIGSIPELAWTDIPSLLLHELDSDSIDVQIEAIKSLMTQHNFLNDTQRCVLYDKLLNNIDLKNDSLKNESLACLVIFTNLYPTEILNIISSRYIISDEITKSIQIDVLKRRLEALSLIAKVPEIGRFFISEIVQIAISESEELSFAALVCLSKLASTKNISFDVRRYLHRCDAIEKLMNIDVGNSIAKMQLVSSICRSVVRVLSTEEQNDILERYMDSLQLNIAEKNAVLFEVLLIPLNPDVIKNINISIFFDELTRLALNSASSIMRIASCKVIAVFIHKLLNTDYINKHIEPLKEKIQNILTSNETFDTKKAVVVLHTWLTKSIVVCGIPKLSQNFLYDQINLLRHNEVGETAAEEFRTLVSKDEDTFTKENGCNIMFLYKQRIFVNLIRENATFFKQERRNFFIALATTLEEIPTELLFLHLKELVPMLAECLKSVSEARLLLPMLTSLQSLLEAEHSIVSAKADHIIPELLVLTTHENMKVRMASLKCLHNYTKYSTSDVYNFKSEVIEKLSVAIDDRKRLVRKIAVNTRIRWFLFEPPIPTNI